MSLSFATHILGFKAVVEYTYYGEERETSEYPGCPESLVIDDAYLWIEGKLVKVPEISNQLYDELEAKALKDYKQ